MKEIDQNMEILKKNEEKEENRDVLPMEEYVRKLEELKDALSQNNTDAIDILELIKPNLKEIINDTESISKMRKYLDKFDFDSAKSLLQQYVKM